MHKECLRIALRELPKHSESMKHWSFIIQRGQIVEWGTNRLGEPSGFYQMGYAPGRHSLHSEVVAYSKARGRMDQRKPWQLINIRLTCSKMLVISAPCPICWSFMRACGCSQFIYTDKHGRFVKILPERNYVSIK